MFGFGRKSRTEKEAARQALVQADLLAAIRDLLPIAEGGPGEPLQGALMLRPGERLVYVIPNGGLFEPRREPGHWSGRSGGFSVPVTDGIRFRIGKSAGTYVQGAEQPTVIDSGVISFTTQRVVFQGGKYTREWSFSKLLGVAHDAHEPWTAIQVSNREKTSGIVYAGLVPESVRLRLAVAIGIFNGDSQEVAKELQDELASTEGGPVTSAVNVNPTAVAPDDTGPTRPPSGSQVASPPPPAAAGASSTAPGPAPPRPAPAWAKDPSGRHQYRWWDGNRWTDFVADNGQQSQDTFPARPS